MFDFRQLWVEGRFASCPRSFGNYQRLRAYFSQLGCYRGNGEPVDMYLMARGDASGPVMKVGGVPHRPRSKPWPLVPVGALAGEPMEFLAQFNFTGTHLANKRTLPGEMLLVFVDNRTTISNGCDLETYHFEWSATAVADPCQFEDLPFTEGLLPGAHGVAQQYVDFTDDASVKNVRDEVARMLSDYTDELSESVAYHLCHVPTCKIGGGPIFSPGIFEDLRKYASDNPKGEFLCGLSIVGPTSGPWPWANQEEPYTEEDMKFGSVADSETWSVRDGHYLNFFIEPDSSVKPLIVFY